MQFILRKPIFRVFFVEFAFSGELFVILFFLSYFVLSYMVFYDIFVFFYFIQKKYILIKLFFTINVPINYPPLSKIIQNLSIFSKSVPKNPKKSRKNPFFLLFFLWSRRTFSKKSLHHSSYETAKKMSEKKVEKKVVFIFANFFFKIHFGHFFMSNFKIKKKVLKS